MTREQASFEFKPGARQNAAPATRDVQKLFDRMPPHSIEAEMSLLGSMILDSRIIGDVISIVPSSDAFYKQSHAAIYDLLVTIYDQHQSGDLVQLQEALRDKQILEDVGGADYLLELARSVPSAVNAPHYARIVRDKAQLRKLIEAAGRILYEAYHVTDVGPDVSREVLDRAEQMIFDIAQHSTGADSERLRDMLQHMMDMLEANEGRTLTGLDTGFYDLNEYTCGLQPGELIIVAARPSMGKTALALNLAEQIAAGGSPHEDAGPQTPVAFFSMEMSKQSVTQRLLCAHANIDSHRLRTNRLTQNDFRKIITSCDELSRLPIYIDDTPGLSVLMLRAKARRMVAQHGVKCLIIDYLQLMSAPSVAREGRQQEVSAISRGVKALARELEIPVICLAQLNRGAEQREGHRPRMADLRESGSIEQDADVILLLHREEYYHQSSPTWAEENPDKVGVAEIIIAKQRNGPTGIVELTWDNSTTRFKNYAAHRGSGYSGGGGHSQPAPAAAEPTEPQQRQHFAPGNKSGPVADFRDGGGPDDDDFSGDDLPPF